MPAGRVGLCVNKPTPITSASPVSDFTGAPFFFFSVSRILQLIPPLLLPFSSPLSFIHSFAGAFSQLTHCAGRIAQTGELRCSYPLCCCCCWAPPMLPGSLRKKKENPQAANVTLTRTTTTREESFFFFFLILPSSHSLMTTKRVFLRLKPTAALWPGSRLPLKPGRSCITIPPSCCRGICTSLQCSFFLSASM